MLAFDTLSAAHDLESAGMERKQAEAVAHAVASLGAAGRDDLATKTDLELLRDDLGQLRTETKADLEQLRTATRTDLEHLSATARADLKAGLSALEARMTWRLVVAAGVIVAAVKLIPGP